MSPGLDGTGRVADDLYLLAHGDVTGRPFIQPRPLGLGLAGALLAELALAGAVTVRHDDIIAPVPVRGSLADGLLVRMVRLLEAEPDTHPVADWLAYLARTAPAGVAARLAACGYLAHVKGVLPWRSRWIPADRDSAFSPVLRVRAALDASRPLTVHAGVLAGLADACGLGFRLAEYAPVHGVRPPGQIAAQLGPGLGALITSTRTAVDSAVLANRV